jgi:hypothetical protein
MGFALPVIDRSDKSIDQSDWCQTTDCAAYRRVEEVLGGAKIQASSTAIVLTFADEKQAFDWCNDMAVKFKEPAIITGDKDWMRCNQYLYHILVYIWEGKLQWSTTTRKWSYHFFANPYAIFALQLFLAHYKLLA